MIDRDDAMLIASRSPESAVLDRVVHRHLSEPATLLLAVSGGVDSTAMLLLAAAVVQRGGSPALEPTVRVPVGFAVAEADDGGHAGSGTAGRMRVGIGASAREG